MPEASSNMQENWLSSYQVGVPPTINPDQYPTLNALIADFLNKYRDRPAYGSMGCSITYAELDQKSRAFAAYLQQEFKLQKGDRFAIMLPNVMQYPIAMLGILRAGGVVVNVNPLYTPDEVALQLSDAAPIGIIVLENFAATVEKALHKIVIPHVIVTRIADIFSPPKSFLVNAVVKYIKRMIPSWEIDKHIKYPQILRDGAKLQLSDPQLKSQDLAFLQYTGGTTGIPKGAMLTHRNMVANVLQCAAWVKQTLVPGQEIMITALPLYHIFSLTVNCLTMYCYGAFNVLIMNPRDVKSFIHDLKKYPYTLITGVNTLFNLLLNQPQFLRLDFKRLKLSIGGGMAVQQAVAEKWLKCTKKPILEGYGLTEASPVVSMNPMHLEHYNGSIGLPVPSTEVGIFDEHGKQQPVDTVGELWVRGPQVMPGYWHNADETAKVLTPDGWLKTGDIAKIDSKGFIYIIDRLKDIIIISGFNVYPNEVEGVIALMPGIREAAVIGVKDPNHGELVKAFVVREDLRITADDVRHFCQQHLTAYKIPKQIEFRDTLPKTNVGKILRRALR